MREFSVSYSPQAGVDLSPSYYTGSYPAAMREQPMSNNGTRSTIRFRARSRRRRAITFNGNDYDDLKPHL